MINLKIFILLNSLVFLFIKQDISAQEFNKTSYENQNLMYYLTSKYKKDIKKYHETGSLEFELNYGNNKIIAKRYYLNGKIKSILIYEDSKGYMKSFYNSGKIKSKTPLFNGSVNGKEEIYDENGVLVYELEIKNNMIINGKKLSQGVLISMNYLDLLEMEMGFR